MLGKRIRKTVLLLAAAFLTGCAAVKNNTDAEESENGSIIEENDESSEVSEKVGASDNNTISENSETGSNFIEEAGAPGSRETEPEPDCEVTENVPGICVNRLGYITKSDKMAVFFGEELPREFHVVRADTEEVVFAGYLRDKGYNEAQQEYNGYGDFSEVQESGTYYIEAPILGKSHSFRIGDDLYQDVLKKACSSYDRKPCDMAVALLAYEMNPDVFTDDTGISESGNEIPDILDEIRYEAEQILQMQDAQTGAVSEDMNGEDAREEAYAMVLAKFSYLYQYYDTEFATECLKAADRAWAYADLREEEDMRAPEKDGWKLAAAAELYRASGRQSFHNYISDYFQEYGYAVEPELPVLLGYVTYISTRQPVELSFCREITRVLTESADEAAEETEDLLLENQEGSIDGSCQELLEDSMYLILINHMITSREYEIVAENILHYLMGRNVQSVNCIENAKENDRRLILLLSEVLSWQKDG